MIRRDVEAGSAIVAWNELFCTQIATTTFYGVFRINSPATTTTERAHVINTTFIQTIQIKSERRATAAGQTKRTKRA
jgi:hypothetical protein